MLGREERAQWQLLVSHEADTIGPTTSLIRPTEGSISRLSPATYQGHLLSSHLLISQGEDGLSTLQCRTGTLSN